MKREEVYQQFKEQLSQVDERTLQNMARIYCDDVPVITKDRLIEDIQKLKEHVPIQYVTGVEYFLDHKFKVSPAVLIPRPETEELVAWIFDDSRSVEESVKVIDVGTGSGIIPISIQLKLPSWKVLGIDVSREALLVARENADLLNAKATFAQADFLNKNEWNFGNVDVLVSNPPYIAFAEAVKMGDSVVKHEPHVALFVKEPMMFYQSLCEYAKEFLNRNGAVYVELNEYRAPETEALFREYFSDVELRKDLQGKYRMLRAKHLLS